MIVPPFSPPTHKSRNICQNNIKYTNYDYNKLKFGETCPFKRKNEKMKCALVPCISRDLKINRFFFMDIIPLRIFIFLDNR
ncbi:hypothetical protein COL30_22370 [Bacillus pseudomycoides]|uniref:Uncharacterized protein n=1 Tax=Bacillus pseudomycoides TaxID=64104 RepID=A0A2B6JZZ6_9BACI|nr:hypothetical protein CON79_24510 [Bacillus pseudomycoides]PEA83428.1 hypothetical protein CON99_11920 [Bacillus pseudomycoides]PED07592.1 hypothetical protein COO19_14705 [Bacillus pseudomycoides]PED70263.1 hypothetical protein CON97_20425 [Bacillus pseudomycoides]PEI35814.1 hypothetical protein CN620_24875 [Bacillus pseudomycoides]